MDESNYCCVCVCVSVNLPSDVGDDIAFIFRSLVNASYNINNNNDNNNNNKKRQNTIVFVGEKQ